MMKTKRVTNVLRIGVVLFQSAIAPCMGKVMTGRHKGEIYGEYTRVGKIS